MSSEYIILQDTPHVETQTWEATVEAPTRKLTLALAKPDSAHPDSCFLTPNAVRTLIDQGVQMFVQYGFGNHNPYSDTDYADAGAEFVGPYADLAILSHIVHKYDPFTFDQLGLSKERQTLVSILSPKELTQEYIKAVNKKKITMLCLDLLVDDNGNADIERIRHETLSEAGFQIALSNYLLPIVETIVHSPTLSFALQKCPSLQKSVLCYDGILCQPQIAEKLHLPCRNLSSTDCQLN